MTLMAVLTTVCALAVGGVTVALLLLPHGHGRAPEPYAAPSAPVSASSVHPKCRGAACEGRSPMVTRCGAQPDTLVRRRMATGAWMEVRYNRWCGASWARTWGARMGDRIEMTAVGAGRPVRRAEIQSDADLDSFVYTPMTVTLPGTVLRICFESAASADPAGSAGKECFETRVGQ
uniref:DUF2690 domain-containing protein n=1 Tax=Streptomyces corallincola TaxID=2851888 RepID=UPI001FE68167|nr:DUF2690 domain-containing protein [Streptomyces corallincola]